MQPQTKRLFNLALGVLVLLLVPLAFTLFNPTSHLMGGPGGGWDWSPGDFVWAFIVLFGAGLTFELITRHADTLAYKLGVGIATFTSLALVWINAAVGIIGEDELFSLMYFSVLAVGMIGIFVARFRATGLAYTAFAMALVQMLVPLTVYLIPNLRPALYETPGIVGVFILNACFAFAYLIAGLFFRHAAIGQRN